ncbi:MAG: GNAT family N-acetyltransferase [Alphaproteobacteria bacterium]|nr:GNAT family N-acetyltransferase [Alphaproteobacteria bacterium]
MLDLGEAPRLETARLVLRLPDKGDLDALEAMYADPAFMRFIGGKTYDRAQSWRSLAQMIGHWALQGFGLFVVEEKASGRCVGRVGVIEPEGWPGPEIAWSIAPVRWGQGLVVEAAAAVRAWGFGSLGQTRLISLIDPGNLASIRLAEKLMARWAGETELLGHRVRVYEHQRG